MADLIDAIAAIAKRIPNQVSLLQTEEATKNALVMPFIQALGYDVFDPTEVVPELVADVGVKKGEKVDYALMKDGKPVILFECKKVGVDLSGIVASQLYRYFSTTGARIGVLTDGVEYRFYSDLDQPNKMDSRPFLVFNMLSYNEALVRELKRFTKEAFDIEATVSAAVEMKYTRALKQALAAEFESPSDELVKFLATKAYDGRMTTGVREQFRDLTKRALHQFINDQINARLKTALGPEEGATKDAPTPAEPEAEEVVTSQEEIDGYLIIKAIVREVVAPGRVAMRDTKSYCGVLLDDNNRKPIARLRMNAASTWYLGLFDEQRNETKVNLEAVDDIYKHADALKATVKRYLAEK